MRYPEWFIHLSRLLSNAFNAWTAIIAFWERWAFWNVFFIIWASEFACLPSDSVCLSFADHFKLPKFSNLAFFRFASCFNSCWCSFFHGFWEFTAPRLSRTYTYFRTESYTFFSNEWNFNLSCSFSTDCDLFIYFICISCSVALAVCHWFCNFLWKCLVMRGDIFPFTFERRNLLLGHGLGFNFANTSQVKFKRCFIFFHFTFLPAKKIPMHIFQIAFLFKVIY